MASLNDLSDEELEKIANGDLDGLSNRALEIVASEGDSSDQAVAQPSIARGKNEDGLSFLLRAAGLGVEPFTNLSGTLEVVAQGLRKTVPEFLAERLGQAGFPTAGAVAGTAVGTVAEAAPITAWELALQAAGGPVVKGAVNVGRKALSLTTGIAEPVIKRAPEFGAEISKLIKSGGAAEAADRATLLLKSAVRESRQSLGAQLERVLDGISNKYPGLTVDVKEAVSFLNQSLEKRGFKTLSASGKAVEIPLSSRTKQVLELANKAEQSGSISFNEAVSLKRMIDDSVDYLAPDDLRVSKSEEAILKQFRHKLNDTIKAIDSPAMKLYAKANEAFSSVASRFDDLANDLLKGKPETIQRRISNVFNKGTVERKAFDKLGRISTEASGQLNTILNALSAEQFGPLVNPRLSRAALNTGGGLGMVGGIGGAIAATNVFGAGPAAGMFGGLLAASSPRVALNVARGAGALGKTNPVFSRALLQSVEGARNE